MRDRHDPHDNEILAPVEASAAEQKEALRLALAIEQMLSPLREAPQISESGDNAAAEQENADLEPLLRSVRLLRHVVHPPSLPATEHQRIAAELEQAFAAKVHTKAVRQNEAKQQRSSWLAWFWNWLGQSDNPGTSRLLFRPALALVGAAVLTSAVLWLGTPRSTPSPIQAMSPAMGVIAHARGPWRADQNPFTLTRSPEERLGYVLDYRQTLHQEQQVQWLGSQRILSRRSP